MNADNPDSLLMRILRLIEEINNVSLRISNACVFGNQSLPKPKFAPPELGFLLAVSWLYILYIEAGKVSTKFLQGHLRTYKLDPNDHVSVHIENVKTIRTYLQHNLDLDVKRNRDTQEACEKWLEKQCRTRLPMDDAQWQDCLVALLHEAIICLTLLKDCIREIEQDESREEIINILNLRRRRYHPPEEFDGLIVLVTADLGRTNINPTRFRQRFYDKWVRDLDMYQGDYDFSTEARGLIEYTLLCEMAKKLPITGKDIMQEFNLSPGPYIEEILQKARLINEREPCPREKLLEKLRLEMSSAVNRSS